MITAVTTCMGRLYHLETTLPLMLEEFDRVVVVDWSCPQHAGEFASSLGASVHYKYGEHYFARGGSRNYGAQVVATEYVAMVDADTMCMPGVGDELRKLLTPDSMVLSSRTASGHDVENLFGFVACSLEAFWNVGGYDESFVGWGHEDSHLRGKLYLEEHLKVKRLSPMALGAIAHDNSIRTEYHEESIEQSSRVNFRKLLSYFEGRGISDWMSDPRTRDITFLKAGHV